MKGEVYDSLGTLMPGIIALYCRTKPDPNIIQDKTLGGSWFVQTVGIAAIKADVELNVTGLEAKDSIFTAWSEGDKITIDYDGYSRTGLIITEPDVQMTRYGHPENRKYSVSFTFAVLTEVADT